MVTGGAGNLGKAVVKKFLEADYQVTSIVHRVSTDKDDEVSNLNTVVLDLLKPDAAQKLVTKYIETENKIDVAVLTAGGFTMSDIAHTETVDIYKQYQLNFETAYNMARPVFLQMMKQNSGRIFLIGSRAGLDVSKAKGVTAYALSKSLIFRLAELMNAEAKGKNVVVSVIVPGTIDTPQNRKAMPEADITQWVTPAEIADVIYFYSSEESKIVREPVIKVYGNS